MEVLKHFHLLNLQGKVTGYSFFRALEFQTDNTGLSSAAVSSFHGVSLANADYFLFEIYSLRAPGFLPLRVFIALYQMIPFKNWRSNFRPTPMMIL